MNMPTNLKTELTLGCIPFQMKTEIFLFMFADDVALWSDRQLMYLKNRTVNETETKRDISI